MLGKQCWLLFHQFSVLSQEKKNSFVLNILDSLRLIVTADEYVATDRVTNEYGRKSHLFLTTMDKALWDLFWLTHTNHRSQSVFT